MTSLRSVVVRGDARIDLLNVIRHRTSGSFAREKLDGMAKSKTGLGGRSAAMG